MRGNRLASRGDPMKTRSQRRRERKAKVDSSARVQRERKHMRKLMARRCAREEDSHMTAIMQSYALRRKAERAAQRLKEEEKEVKDAGLSSSEKAQGSGRKDTSSVASARSGVARPVHHEVRGVRERQSKMITRSLY